MTAKSETLRNFTNFGINLLKKYVILTPQKKRAQIDSYRFRILLTGPNVEALPMGPGHVRARTWKRPGPFGAGTIWAPCPRVGDHVFSPVLENSLRPGRQSGRPLTKRLGNGRFLTTDFEQFVILFLKIDFISQ